MRSFMRGWIVNPIAALAGVAAAMLGSTAARGDVVTAQWINNTAYSYEITHMPDFDQRRSPAPGIPGLPANGGMYCVPTSTVNLMAYAANHGFPFLEPGPGAWHLQALYNEATNAITIMGIYMGTDPQDGTNGAGWIDGTNQWLADAGVAGLFTATQSYHTGLIGPNLNLIAKKGIQGNIVSIAYGRYERIGTVNGIPLYDRTGGHAVTVAKAERVGSLQKLWVRDPADDPADSSQSVFVNRLWNVTYVLAYVQTNSGNVQRLFSALDYQVPAIGEKVRFIDGMVTLRPKFGLSFINTGGPTLVLTSPIVLQGANPVPTQINVNVPGALLDAIMANDLTEAFTLQELPGLPARLHRIDVATGESQPLSELPGADQIASSPKPAVYVMSETQLQCIDLAAEIPQPTTIPLPLPGSAITYDSVKNETVVLSVPARRLMRYRNLQDPPTLMEIPTSIPLMGMAKIAIDPTTGLYWFVSQGTHRMHGWNLNAAGGPVFDQAELPGKQQPLSVDFDDQGHMFVSHSEGVMELRHAGAAAGWVVLPDSPFANAPGGTAFRITKSETNFDPALHNGPGWVNISPEQLTFGQLVPDCHGDVNRSGVTNVTDLLIVINSWGPCPIGPCPADAAGTGRVVNVEDLLAVIGGWGPCP